MSLPNFNQNPNRSEANSFVSYVGDGVTKEYRFDIDYLRREFIKVEINGIRQSGWVFKEDRVIVLANPVPVEDILTIKRITDSARIVEFIDGSILKSKDLNISAIQTVHISEEARDYMTNTVGVDDEGNIDARFKRVVRVQDAVDDFDATNKRYVDSEGQFAMSHAHASATAAKASEVAAKASEVAALAHKNTTKASEVAAKASEVAAKASELAAAAAAAAAKASENAAHDSANAADASEAAAKASEVAAKADADRAEYWADMLDADVINERIDGVEAKANDNAGRIQAIETDTYRFGFRGAAPADLDTATTHGVYSASPTGGVPFLYGTLIVYETSPHSGVAAQNWITQIFHGTNHRTYQRENINLDGWTPWAEVYDSRRLTFEF